MQRTPGGKPPFLLSTPSLPLLLAHRPAGAVRLHHVERLDVCSEWHLTQVPAQLSAAQHGAARAQHDRAAHIGSRRRAQQASNKAEVTRSSTNL